MIVSVAASPSIDKLFEVERLQPGAIHRPARFVQVPGGKGLNVARAAAVLGEAVVATGLLAGHAGRWVEEALAAEGVDARFVWAASGETRASLSVADRETDGLTEFYEAAPRVTEVEWRALEGAVDALLASASWLAITGSAPAGMPADGYGRLVAAARDAGVACAVDATGAWLADAVRRQPDLVKINVHEAEELLGAPVHGVDGAREAAAEIRARAGGDGHAAVVTMGADGAILAGPDGTAWLGRLYVRGPYPVGSGDAFLAGLVAGRRRGEPWEAAMRLALGTAAANAEVQGAGRLAAERAAELAAASEVRALG